jgi:hypothetical protein
MKLVFVFLSNQSSTANFEALSHGTNNVNANLATTWKEAI